MEGVHLHTMKRNSNLKVWQCPFEMRPHVLSSRQARLFSRKAISKAMFET